MGIEPTSSAWKAEVLPLNYTRCGDRAYHALTEILMFGPIAGGGGRIRTSEGGAVRFTV